MPEVSRFFGIIITLNYNDHSPPHFHARYGSERAIIEIDTLRLIGGNLSPRVLGLTVEWASQHTDELREDWLLARSKLELNPIPPLA
jgi:hypothetical protein